MFDDSVEKHNLTLAANSLDTLAEIIHDRNIRAGWWPRDENGNVLDRNMGELLCLVHSEISEALEGHRKGLPDDKLPQYPMLIVELVDALIREFDILGRICAQHDVSLSEVFMAKINFNAVRSDHKIENRMKEGGKKY